MDLKRTPPPHPLDHLPAAPTELTVTSEDFADGQPLPQSAGFGFGNTSPQLSWSGAPEGTQSYLLLCHDPDAPVVGGFNHWAVAGIPADVTSLAPGAGDFGQPIGEGRAVTLANDYGTRDFGGAAPPEGDGPHRYVFTVWALDSDTSGLDAATSVAKAQFSTLGNVLARGSVTGTYQL
ncbi:YbhB/YbcL family Raf kinase inhibitor-like protein [Ornithinimicrobium avium]|uniref:YbhB/YbcL family Raf kinase inhibitor-like protein n=1 Tax=Ornithinimicrobium avium TaxID=2283195 RepID=A0A345NJG5_9MICO|nr:YbhB/YbcL family Raf kinase inhibitor-like protein [Ornithinimicrobium avium]AXH95173.1 YbhB/YbcL family Raf kinase inhibitor-like protein [Ornithinimicrobium avium]